MKQSQSELSVFELEDSDKGKHYFIIFEKGGKTYLYEATTRMFDSLALLDAYDHRIESPFTAYRCVEINPEEILNK